MLTGRRALTIVGLWAFCGCLWITQAAAMAVAVGRPVPPLAMLARANLTLAAAWAVMTFIIVAAVHRWPARRDGWPARIAIHAGLALAVAAIFFVGRWLMISPDGPLLTLPHTSWLTWDLTTYAVVAAWAHAAHLADARRERDVRLARLEGELASAELDALKWQLQPGFLERTLDDIADVATRDAERADDMTTSLGALLRLILQQIGTETSTVQREVEMAEAYLDIERMRAPGRLSARVSVPPEALDAQLPGMLLVPVIEELIGATADASREHGPLAVAIDAVRVHGTVAITVHCTGDGLADPAVLGAVTRARTRLAALHGERQRVFVDASRPRARSVTFEFPFEAAGDAGAPPRLRLAARS